MAIPSDRLTNDLMRPPWRALDPSDAVDGELANPEWMTPRRATQLAERAAARHGVEGQ